MPQIHFSHIQEECKTIDLVTCKQILSSVGSLVKTNPAFHLFLSLHKPPSLILKQIHFLASDLHSIYRIPSPPVRSAGACRTSSPGRSHIACLLAVGPIQPQRFSEPIFEPILEGFLAFYIILSNLSLPPHNQTTSCEIKDAFVF